MLGNLNVLDGVSVDVSARPGLLEGFGIDVGATRTKIGGRVRLRAWVGHDVGPTAGGGRRGAHGDGDTRSRRDPNVNLVYTINEPAAAGRRRGAQGGLRSEKDVSIVSVEAAAPASRTPKAGVIGATSQQYPLKMAEMGVEAIAAYAKDGTKPKSAPAAGYTDTGVTLIADKPVGTASSPRTPRWPGQLLGLIMSASKPSCRSVGRGDVGAPRCETFSTRVARTA